MKSGGAFFNGDESDDETHAQDSTSRDINWRVIGGSLGAATLGIATLAVRASLWLFQL
ncbi:MAG: hypothetical protein RCG15_06520 [Candidatus Rickettsia vulgarisii]